MFTVNSADDVFCSKLEEEANLLLKINVNTSDKQDGHCPNSEWRMANREWKTVHCALYIFDCQKAIAK